MPKVCLAKGTFPGNHHIVKCVQVSDSRRQLMQSPHVCIAAITGTAGSLPLKGTDVFTFSADSLEVLTAPSCMQVRVCPPARRGSDR